MCRLVSFKVKHNLVFCAREPAQKTGVILMSLVSKMYLREYQNENIESVYLL
jgi:hypothetical protein